MISVVVGLLLVAYQINQATNIASAQARAEYTAACRALDSTRQSEIFAEVLAKSIYHPDELTPAEILELDAYYIGVTVRPSQLGCWNPKVPLADRRRFRGAVSFRERVCAFVVESQERTIHTNRERRRAVSGGHGRSDSSVRF